jgi:GNAT superfamily N-acetyltransferase
MAITLRPAHHDDEAFLYQLYASTRATELAAYGWDAAQQAAFLQLQFRGQRAHYAEYPNADDQIIFDDAQPIGRLFVSRLEKEIRLVDVALLPEWRGQGIGAQLIRELLSEAARAGLPVRLHVEKFNPARQLYERLGFVLTSDARSHYLMEWQPTQK